MDEIYKKFTDKYGEFSQDKMDMIYNELKFGERLLKEFKSIYTDNENMNDYIKFVINYDLTNLIDVAFNDIDSVVFKKEE